MMSRSIVAAVCVLSAVAAMAAEPPFTTDFNIGACTFSTIGRNQFFVLEPGYTLFYEGDDDGELVELRIRVLRDTLAINVPGAGWVLARVVEEREWADGELKEVSRNFFAFCKQTGNMFYLGEDVDIFEDDGTVSHDGAWRAGRNGARAGVIMPGSFLLGSRYFQEIAPNVAMDRAENTRMGLTIDTPAGRFRNAVEVIETTPLEPGSQSRKVYAPGVGLIIDGVLRLTEVDDAD
ncbi:MAG: hypothetical protein ACREAA_04640 [Candidatus Polarisedimenticolia bacterium]